MAGKVFSGAAMALLTVLFAQTATAQGAAQVHELFQADLQERMDADRARVRLLLLLSPT